MVDVGRKKSNLRPTPARFFFWTIQKQDQITRFVTMHMWSAVSAVLVAALIDLVTLKMALQIIFFGGLAVGGVFWTLIEHRRSWLLSISDPELKAEAHRVMVDYLAGKVTIGRDCPHRLNKSGVCHTGSGL